MLTMIKVICQICFERFWDVSTGRQLQRILVDVSGFLYCGKMLSSCVMTNTHFIVVINSNNNWESTMNIYDLAAVRNPHSKPREILCASVKVGHINL
jgi:hypothetical protein